MGLKQRSIGPATRPGRARYWLLVGLSLSLAVGASPAQAADGGEAESYPACAHVPTANDVSAAQGAYKAGQVSFQEADYERALLYWEDAFRRDCTAHKLLLNLARAYELSGDLSGAVNALQTYIGRAPEADDRASVEKRIARLREKLEEERAATAAATPPSPAASDDATTTTTGTDSAPTTRAKPIWPVVLTASGAATIVIGSTVGVLGALDIGKEKDRIAGSFSTADGAQCERDGRQWSCPEDLLEEVQVALDNSDELARAKTMRNLGIVVGVGGAALAGVGAYFWYKLWSAPTTRSAARSGGVHDGVSRTPPLLVPLVSPSFAGLRFNAQF